MTTSISSFRSFAQVGAKTSRLRGAPLSELSVMEIFFDEREKNLDWLLRNVSFRDLLADIESSTMFTMFQDKGGSKGVNGGGNGGAAANVVDFRVPAIKARDLRRLECVHFGPLEDPIIMVRQNVVLISFDPYRVICLNNRAIMIVPQGSDSLLSDFRNSLMSWKKESDIPFEAHTYETIITSGIRLLYNDYENTERLVQSVLRRFKQTQTSIVGIDAQETMRLLKNKLQSMIAKVASYRRCLTELLEDDYEMAYMNLTILGQTPSYYLCEDLAFKSTHQDIEVLCESYLADYNSLAMKMSLLEKSMQNAEELCSLRLDTSRNQLLVADTILSIVAICLAMGSFVGSILGMNLHTGVEQEKGVFTTVVIFTIVVMLVVGLGIVALFQQMAILPKAFSSEPLSPLSQPTPFQLM